MMKYNSMKTAPKGRMPPMTIVKRRFRYLEGAMVVKVQHMHTLYNVHDTYRIDAHKFK